MDILSELQRRGSVAQCSDESELRQALAHGELTFYAGFDATADSLHVGSLVPIMAMRRLQQAGHRPIAIIGGATTEIGDPSGKTGERPLLSRESIIENGERILGQLRRYLDLDGDQGVFRNNADWLRQRGYIEFLRDIGRHFKVNEMIKMEALKQRLEREEGLSFIEFNYPLLQAADFLFLYDEYSCVLQVGGNDQWGNITAGIELIRRMRRRPVYGLTFPLLTTARGHKMGKTESGTIWLDEEKTSAFDFYQYWVNVDDSDVARNLALYTLLPMDEVEDLTKKTGAELRAAKEVLALEVTRLAHGDEAAIKAQQTSRALFGKRGDASDTPTTIVAREELANGINVIDLFCRAGLATTKGTVRRLVDQGGAYVNDKRVSSPDDEITEGDLKDGSILLRHGKKRFHRVTVG